MAHPTQEASGALWWLAFLGLGLVFLVNAINQFGAVHEWNDLETLEILPIQAPVGGDGDDSAAAETQAPLESVDPERGEEAGPDTGLAVSDSRGLRPQTTLKHIVRRLALSWKILKLHPADAINAHPAALLLSFCFWGCGGVLCLSLLWRMVNWASPAYLLRTRFYEVVSVRAILFLVNAWLWYATAYVLWNSAQFFYAYLNAERQYARDLHAGLLYAGVGIVALVLAVLFFHRVYAVDDMPPLRISVRQAKLRRRISRRALRRLGKERFPNEIARFQAVGLRVRLLIMAATFLYMASLIAVGIGHSQEAEWATVTWSTTVEIAGHLGDLHGHLPANVASAAVYAGVVIFVMSLVTNRNYQLMRFPYMLCLQGLCIGVIYKGLAALQCPPHALPVVLAGQLFLLAVRFGSDRSQADNYKAFYRLYHGISRTVRRAFPKLQSLPARSEVALKPLDANALCERISQGCQNVEEASRFVKRCFGRFLRLVRVDYEQFVGAQLRYLTVGRFVTTSGGCGTTAPLRYPKVPAWNETLFPLNPPGGYVNWLDPLPLGSEWDIVQYCGSCGGSGRVSCTTCSGSGRVSRMESRTNYQGHMETVSVESTCTSCGGSGRQTCSTCGGTGRLQYSQILNTQWTRLLPTAMAPDVPMPELMEDAEEEVYYTCSFVENRVPYVDVSKAPAVGDQLEGLIAKAENQLASAHAAHAAQVEETFGGILYRADFRLIGFWATRIKFRRLPGKTGWFFGRRPEFYFPRLPLSWSMVAMTILFPPLASFLTAQYACILPYYVALLEWWVFAAG